MQTEKVHAIVLSCNDFSESDMVASLFTLEHGLLRGFAKGARKSVKRFGGSLEPPNCLEAVLGIKAEGLCRLQSAELSVCHPSIRGRLESIALAMYACELVELLTPEGHPIPRLFRLLACLVDYLDRHDANRSDRRFYEINVLNILGYRPELTEGTHQTLKECLRTGKFGHIKFTEEEIRGAGMILDAAITTHIHRPLQSLKFLDAILESNR